MLRLRRLAILAALSACGDPSSPTMGGTGDASTTADPSAGADTSENEGSSASADASESVAASTEGSADASADATGDASETGDATEETSGELGPVELYRGPVDGGVLPGWDADVPRPLVMLGRQGQDWIATLAGIDETGALFDNVADEIVVWGWNDAPPLLYDGPVVGGAIPDWSADDPLPVVMLAQTGTTSWATTLAFIGPDGALEQNVADRIVVWGWPAATPGAPTSRYAGPVDAGAVLRGWNPDAPEPLVMLGRVPGTNMWVATLARVAPDGTLSDNLTTELRVWGW